MVMTFSTSRALARRLMLLMLSIVMIGWSAHLGAAATRSPSEFVGEAFHEGLAVNGAPPEISPSAKTAEDVREIVSNHLSAQLLRGLDTVSGTDFRMKAAADSLTLHAGVLILGYADDATAKQMQ